MARAVACVKHPSVPPEMQETAYNVAVSGFPFGPEKRGICGTSTCPCGHGHAETVEHTFWRCARSRRLFELILAQWREVTGEKKVTADHGRIVLFGDRSCTWASAAEEGEWAGLAEAFAIVHKGTLHVLLQERNRDAAPNPPGRRTAAQLYQKVQSVAQRIMAGRWKAAVAGRHADGGASVAKLRKLWEAPGLAAVASDESSMTIVLFMRRETRNRWRRPAPNARAFRSQQHAPPDTLPTGTIEVYPGGSADARKKNEPPPPAGFGYEAYVGGRKVFVSCGEIIAHSTPNVRTTTENLAELVAFTRALNWARQYAHAMGKPILIRYSSEYAARIATGAWRAKKHRAMADEAQRAWGALKRSSGGRVWMRYVSSKAAEADAASRLAGRGKRGEKVYEAVDEAGGGSNQRSTRAGPVGNSAQASLESWFATTAFGAQPVVVGPAQPYNSWLSDD